MPDVPPTTVDDYISTFPPDVQAVLQEVRQTIRRAAPAAHETISYRMPTMTLGGTALVHFAAWTHHISVYPVPAGDDAFEREIAPYRAAKSTARFALGEPLPHELIERLVTLLAQRHP